jgi:predicted tellurium resistance membrane protein TerC
MRLGLLATIAWIIGLTAPVFAVAGIDFSWKDMILIAGGLFLVYKATTEIHHAVDPVDKAGVSKVEVATLSFGAAIVQILMLDLVFSLDSIITAVGMTKELGIMVIAVIVAVTAMLFAAGPLARFIERNPTIVMLALGFLLMIGMTLIAEGFHFHVEKGYVYAAMAFSGFIEFLNMLGRGRKAKKDSLRARPSLSVQR